MSDITQYNPSLPQTMPQAAPSTVATWTRQGREIARQNRQTELQARQDFNNARLAVHRTQLNMIVEKAKNQARAELVQDVLLHARAVDDLVTNLSAGRPMLEMTLREIQQGYMMGESQRILRRGIGI